MQNSITDRVAKKVATLERDLRYARVRFNEQELVFRAIDERPLTAFETSISHWQGFDTDYVTVYYKVPSIKEMLPVLEYFERIFDIECTSWDDKEDGHRDFDFKSSFFGISLTLRVTPQEEGENITCRKVIVGEKIETTTTKSPIYELICD